MLCLLCVPMVVGSGVGRTSGIASDVVSGFSRTVTAQDLSSVQTIRIGVLRNGAYDVVTLPLETYVARVLAGEALPGSEPAAMEALAIAIRTYTVGNRGKHRAEGFDLCDQTHCQVMRTSVPATERAALATAGRVLLYKGEPATVFYSASCGGRTEKPSNVWPGSEDLPYLPSKSDDGCGGFPEWRTELTLADLERALHGAGYTGTLKNMRVASRNESGRVARLALDGLTPSRISGQDLRAAIGRSISWQYLQSAAFELKRTGDSFRFEGHGAGHGVGMCVIGSAKLATAGQSAAQILTRYFPGTDITSVGPRMTAAPPADRPVIAPPRPAAAPAPARPAAPAPVDLALSLPEGDDGERAVVTTLVRRERDALSNILDVSAPPRLTVRFHPTTDAFERATGMPWYALGSVKSGDLHFVPMNVLRDRGVLERTVRHQIVHALADASFANRPAWVREGAALHFSETGSSVAPLGRGACPEDVELLRPTSIGALSDAMVRARACFERQLSSGKSWRDVK